MAVKVKQELIDLYHAYIAVTNNQAAAACLVILDVLGQGSPRTHTLLAGDDNLQAPDTGFVPLSEPTPPEQPDEWASLLIAYKELKKRV